METFDLESHLQDAYSRFPEAKHQPIIGLTANYEGIDATLRDRYYKQVIAAGGTPVIIPPVADAQVIVNTLEHLDGLILTGGGDHNPLWMGEEPSPRLHNINQERDAAELMITRLAFNRQIPMLGICRGIQTLAIALGGKVCQDIKQLVKHSQDADRTEPTHIVEIKTICWCGRKATMVARIVDGQFVKQGEQIVVGGNDMYVSLCRKHYNDGRLGPEK